MSTASCAAGTAAPSLPKPGGEPSFPDFNSARSETVRPPRGSLTRSAAKELFTALADGNSSVLLEIAGICLCFRESSRNCGHFREIALFFVVLHIEITTSVAFHIHRN
jgi:hypothetical protein